VVGTAAVTVTPRLTNAPTATGGSRSIYSGLAGGGSRAPWVDDIDIFDTATFLIKTSPVTVPPRWSERVDLRTNVGFTTGTDSFTFAATDGGGASVDGFMRLVVFDGTALTTCTRAGTVNGAGMFGSRPQTHPCAHFNEPTLAWERERPRQRSITYATGRSTPIRCAALSVLIGGGDLTMNLDGDDFTGVATELEGAISWCAPGNGSPIKATSRHHRVAGQ